MERLTDAVSEFQKTIAQLNRYLFSFIIVLELGFRSFQLLVKSATSEAKSVSAMVCLRLL